MGKAAIDGKEISRIARPAAVEWPVPLNTPPETRLARDLWLAVLDLDTAPFLVELGEDKTWEMSRAGKLEIPIKVVRRGEMKQPVTLTAIALPANVKAAAVTIAPEAAEGKLALEIADKAVPGVYDIRLQAQAAVPYRRDPQSADAAAAAKQQIDKIAGRAGSCLASDRTARLAAEKLATDTAATSKQATELAQAETQKSSAAAEAAKAAAAKVPQAREALEKDSTNQDLIAAKDGAEKAASEAQTQAQTTAAAQAAADKAAAEATAKMQAAAADKVVKDKFAADAAAKAKAAADAKTAADKRAADLAKAAEQKNVNVFETSTASVLKITSAPLTLAVTQPAAAIKSGLPGEIPVAVTRLYGFADPLEIELIVPEAVKGVSAAKLTVPPDQAEAKFALVTTAETPAGKHALIARHQIQIRRRRLYR